MLAALPGLDELYPEPAAAARALLARFASRLRALLEALRSLVWRAGPQCDQPRHATSRAEQRARV